MGTVPNAPTLIISREALVRRIVYGVLLFSGVVLGQVTAQLPGASVTDGPALLSDYNVNVIAAKNRYSMSLRAARAAYFKSILAADDAYIAKLNAGLKDAMQKQDLQIVERLDQQRTAATAERQLHFNVAFNSHSVTIVSATWTARDQTMDVTDKLKEIVATNQQSVHAWAGTFGDPVRNVPKNMTISLIVDGEPQTLYVKEDAALPSILFTAMLPKSDPAYRDPFQ